MLRKLVHKSALGLYVVGSIAVAAILCLAFLRTHHPFFFIAIVIEILGLLTGWMELYLLGRKHASRANTQEISTVRVYVFVEGEDLDTARISLLSCKYLQGSPGVTVYAPPERYDIESLCDEFGFRFETAGFSLVDDAQDVLITNAHTILYPDALRVAQRRCDESMSYVELNHSIYSAHALGNSNVADDASRASLIATAASSFSIGVYTGGPVLAKSNDLAYLAERQENLYTFADVIGLLSSNDVNGAITSHPCCECISHNEIDNNISSRIEKFKVARRTKVFNRKGKVSLRRKIAHLYSRIYWYRSIELLLLGLLAMGVVFFSMPTNNFAFLGALVFVAQISNYVCSHLRGDHRRPLERLRDCVLDCEAFIHVLSLKIWHGSHSRRYRIRFIPVYLCALVIAVVIQVALSLHAYEFGSSVFVQHIISLSVGGVVIVVLYRAMYRYFTARQRAFARRSVSITGSSSYESMWIVDLTHRGAAYISDSRLELGDETPLVFRVPTMTGDSLITVVGRVTYCGPRGSQYQVGVAFKELSQSALDDLTVYCSIIYPYHQARHIEDEENTSHDIQVSSRYGDRTRRDTLSILTYGFVSFALIGALLSSIPVAASPGLQRRGPSSGIVASLTSSKYSFATLVTKVELAQQSDPSTDSDLHASGAYDLSVSQEFLDTPPGGFHQGDRVNIRVSAFNVGTIPARAGFTVSESLGADFDAKSIVMTNTSGFTPCGFSEDTIECVSTSDLAVGESRSFEFSVVSHVVASSPSERRSVKAHVQPSGLDGKEQQSPVMSMSNNFSAHVVPVGDGPAIGDRVYFDANGNGIADSGERGIAGVRVDLLQFKDINGDAIMDPGETPVIAHDVSDSNGYFGVSKGTSSFQHLSPGYQYALTFSGLPQGLQATMKNPGSDVDPQTLTSSWHTLNTDEVYTDADLGIVSSVNNLSTTVFIDSQRNGRIDENEVGIDTGTVRLIRWVDLNTNNRMDDGEVGTSPIAFVAATPQGGIAFSSVRDDMFPTFYALALNVPAGYALRDPGIPNNTDLSTTRFLSAKKFNEMPVALNERGSSVSGTVYADVNTNARLDNNEYGPTLSVQLQSVDGKTTLVTKTNHEGKYVFTNVLPGRYFVGVEKSSLPKNFVVPGFDNQSVTRGVDGRTDISIPVVVNERVSLRDLPLTYVAALQASPLQRTSTFGQAIKRGHLSEATLSSHEARQIRTMSLILVSASAFCIIVTLALRRKLIFRGK